MTMLDNEHLQQTKTAELWTPSVDQLQTMHSHGFYSYGIMTSLFDESGNIIMLQHKGSEKIPHGTWGVLGETSHVHVDSSGTVEVEPTVKTLLRGISEELSVTLSTGDIWVPEVGAHFMTKWAVVKQYKRQEGVVLSHEVMVSNAARDAILDSPPTNEVMYKELMSPEEAAELELIRPGTRELMSRQVELRTSRKCSSYINPADIDWHLNGGRDAILPAVFNGPVS